MIIAIGGPAAVKAATGTTGNAVGNYVNASATVGYAEAVSVAPTSGFYTVLGLARSAWTGATACAANRDACEGSILVNVAPR